MFSEERSNENPEAPLDNLSSISTTNGNSSPLISRRNKFEKLNVDIPYSRTITKESSEASNKDPSKTSEGEEMKLCSFPSSMKSQDKAQGEKSENDSTNLEGSHYRLTTDYDVIWESLGKGSFGEVYKCINKLDKNEYAVKISEIPRKKFFRRSQICLNEICALASLTSLENNFNVVRYYHSWMENDRYYLVMEYCPSSLNKERKNKGQFSEEELKKILRDVCLGLSFLHRNDFVHLDVKTENILISRTGRCKLGDLGQTKKLTESEGDLDEGDCRYLAPEFFDSNFQKDKKDYKKVDIFSLGMTLFELATDHDLQINGSEWKELRDDKLYRLDQVSHLSKEFKALIRRMLKKDPSQRPSADEILNQYLLSDEEANLKWEKVSQDLLEREKKDLEGRLENMKRRRNSVS